LKNINTEKRIRCFVSMVFLLIVVLIWFSSCGCGQVTEVSKDSNHTTNTTPGNDQAQKPHVHEWSPFQVTKEPTCMGVGEETKVCACGESFVQLIQPKGHSYGGWQTVKEPTCTEQGETKRECACGSYETKSIPVNGHSYTKTVTPPTCEERGYTTFTCACGYSYVDLYVEAPGHEYGEWVTVKEATATEQGKKRRECACGKVETRIIPVQGHEYTAVVTEPTCEERGYTTYTCSHCGDSYVDLYVKAKGHAFGAWQTVEAPTCTEKGKKERSCACGKVESEEIAESGHDYVSSVTPATCTQDGYAYRGCSVCEYETVEVLYATGHEVSGYSDYTEPSCLTSGSRSGNCERCGESVTEEIAAIGHTASELYFTDDTCGDRKLGYILCTVCEETIAEFGHMYKETVVKPTCTESGKKIATCRHCGDSYEVTLPASGHYAGEWQVILAAGCTEAGEKVRHCTTCSSLVERAAIDPVGHSYESAAVSGGVRYACIHCDDSYFVEANDYITLHFLCGEDKICSDLQIKKGTVAVLPAPEKEGYVFDGWYLNEDLTDKCLSSYLFEEDTLLYGVWREASLSGEVATNNLVTDAPLDFTFEVQSSVKLTDANLAEYIFIKDLDEKAPVLYIVSEVDGVYTIGCQGYLPGMGYQVLLREEVSFVNVSGRELWFITEKENTHHAKFHDDVVFIAESDLYGCFEEDEGLFVFLSEDLLDAGDNAVIYRDEIDNVVLIVEILAEGRLESLYAYQIEAAEFDDVFKEYELYYSGELDLEGIEFDENLKEMMTEELKASAVYLNFRRAATLFAGFEHGDYYYDENGTKVNPSVKVEETKIQFTVEIVTEFARMHTETHKVDSLFTVTLAVEMEVALDFTIDVSAADKFVFAVEVDTTAKINIFASAKSEKDTKDLKFFQKLYEEAQKDGSFSGVDSGKAESKKEVPIGSIPFNFWGVSFRFTVYNIFDFEAVGEVGVGTEAHMTVEIGLRRSGERTSIIKSFKSSAQVSFYMMGKVEVSDMLKFEFKVSLFGIVNTFVNASVGPYFEMGGMLSATFATTGVHSFVASGYISCGVKVNAKVGANAQISVWCLFEGWKTATLYDEEWTVYSDTFKLFSFGDKEIPLYFEQTKENKELDYTCGSDLTLSETVDTSAVIQDFSSMEKKTKKLTCKYYLNGTYSGVTLTEDGILKVIQENTDTVEIKVVCGTIYKLVTLKLHISHDVITVEHQEATCTEDGHTAATYCRGCEMVFAGEYIKYPALGHSYVTVTVAPTCHERGCTMEDCTRCDAFVVDSTTYVLPKDHTDDGSGTCSACGEACGHYHAFNEKNTAEKYLVSAAACTTPARYYYSCSCGAIGIEIFDDKPLGHSDPDKDGMCNVCGRRVDGLFDAEGNLLASWYELVHVYGMDVTNDFNSYSYSRYTNSPYYVLKNTKELAGGVKLVIGDVERIGNYTFYNSSQLLDVIIPEGVTCIGWYAFGNSKIESVTIPASVTKIEKDAFKSCYSLRKLYISDLVAWCNLEFESSTSMPLYMGELYLNGEAVTDLVIPDGVEHIDDYRFMGCCNITNLTLPGSVTSIEKNAFAGCLGLTDLVLPNGVTSIGEYAFNGCTALTSVTIPAGLTSIEACAFYGCDSLVNIYLTDLAAWCRIEIDASDGSSPLSGGSQRDKKLFLNGKLITELVIPDGVTTIPYARFVNCTSITRAVIPNGVTDIGEYAFWDCTGLVSVTMPKNMTSIGYGAFYNCTALVEVTMPDSMSSIDYAAFYNCQSLISIVIPNGITSLRGAFEKCTNLSSITFPSTLTRVSSGTFSECDKLNYVYITDLAAWCQITFEGYNAHPLRPSVYYSKYLYLNGELITNLVIPDGVTEISYGAFANCRSITSVTIPNSVKLIGEYAFCYCIGLTGITIPGSVEEIGDNAFYGCNKLKDVILSEGIKVIGESPFNGCKLESVTIPGSIEAWDDDAFFGCDELKSVIISDGVTHIGSLAFNCCRELESVTIPASVTSIARKAFYDCRFLSTIVFEGTVEEWNALGKGSSWNYKVPATEVQCSDGTAAL